MRRLQESSGCSLAIRGSREASSAEDKLHVLITGANEDAVETALASLAQLVPELMSGRVGDDEQEEES